MSRTVLVIVAVVFIVAILLLASDYIGGSRRAGEKRVHDIDDFKWNMSDDFGGNSEEVRKWQNTR